MERAVPGEPLPADKELVQQIDQCITEIRRLRHEMKLDSARIEAAGARTDRILKSLLERRESA